MNSSPSLLYIDTAYTLREVREKKHDSFLVARHASGFFKRVWSVHPLADLVGSEKGKVDISHFTSNHVVIEGKVELMKLPHIFMPINFLISQFHLYRMLVNLVRENDITIVVATDPHFSGLLGWAVARACRKPLGIRIVGNTDDIYEATGALAMPRLLPSYRLQKTVQRFVLSRADLVSAVNRNHLAFAVANGAHRVTAVVPLSSHVADVHRAPPAERKEGKSLLASYGVPTEGPTLLYVGRLVDLKHPDDALRAMAAVIKRCAMAQGVFVGGGPMQDELQTIADELGVSESIHFLGQVDQRTLSEIIPQCIVLAPGAGQTAVIECALGGAPIVGADRDFQPEFIEDGVDGFIVPFRDHEAMAERTMQLIANPELVATFSSAIRTKAFHHVDPEEVKSAEWSPYQTVLGNFQSRLEQ